MPIPFESIERRILILRGQKVLLDNHLAELYGVPTGQLKRAVARNLTRFPGDFMLRMSAAEYYALRCQFGILKRGEHSKYPPLAFTEQGIAMLSSVLKSPRAVAIHITIIRVFVRLRKLAASHRALARRVGRLESVSKKHGVEINGLLAAFHGMDKQDDRPRIGFRPGK